MQRILRFVEGEIRGLHEAAYLLGVFTLLSTLLALLRDRLLAGTFGAGELLDVYYAAFRIPDVVFVAIASLVSVFILVPVLTRIDIAQSRHDLIGNILFGFGLLMLSVSAILYFALPTLLTHFFPDLITVGDNTLLNVSRVLLLQPILLGISGILASVTQAHGRFVLYALAPVLYNVAIIFGIVVLYPSAGIVGIGYGVVLGAFLHAAIQVPFIVRSGYLRLSSFKLRVAQLWNITAISVPRTISLTANHFALFALVAFAATLGVGSVSVFSLAFNLQSAPLAIIGASYSVAAFPTLARFFSHGRTAEFRDQMLTAARHIIFWSVPIIVLTIVLRAQIVRTVLGSGAFDWTATRLTAAALALFVISLVAQSLTLLFVRGYYAAGETVKPLVINVATAIGVIVSAFVLVYAFRAHELWRFFVEDALRVSGLPGTEVLMLPLAYTLFALVNAVVFIFLFRRDFGSMAAGRLERTFFESFSAAIVAGFAAHQMLRALSVVLDINTFIGIFTQGFVAGIVGIIAGIITLSLLGNRELKEVQRAVHAKFWKYVPIFSSGAERGTDV